MNTIKELIAKMFTLKRRKERRFRAQGSVFVVFGPLLNKGKPIIDISMSGLSYIDGEDQLTRSYGLNILADDSLYFDNRVSFIPISKSGQAYIPDNSKTNRHAVQFKGLTLEQKSQLKNFIQEHTVGKV